MVIKWYLIEALLLDVPLVELEDTHQGEIGYRTGRENLKIEFLNKKQFCDFYPNCSPLIF